MVHFVADMGKKASSRPDVIATELEKLRGTQVDGKVNLGDVAYIKRALDEAATKVALTSPTH